MSGRAQIGGGPPLRARSPIMFAFFGRIFEATLRRGFHAVRLSGAMPVELNGARKLVLYLNHPSWWDGVAYVVLARRLMPNRIVYAPIDAAMLRRYPFLGQIGGFGVEQDSPRGSAHFLASCRAALAADAPLMIAAQGRFADTRERPLNLRPGLAHLVDIEPDICFLPLALEYTFWNEKQPEMLISFGAPTSGVELRPLRRPARLQVLEQRLTTALDQLSAAAMSRNPALFSELVAGARGVNPVYDGWRRLKAIARGKSFSPEHGAEEI